MTNILNFPERPEKTKTYEFLQDSDDTLRFDDVSQTTTHAFSPPEEPGSLKRQCVQSKDWSNQELADLFRVKRLLNAAGVASHTDRGVTDEGDPWFLFCDAADKVFIHLCRIDGIYVLDSPNIKTPLSGYDFNGLIEQFTERQISGSNKGLGPPDHRVVSLERNGKVFMHPSTMLTALIWTLFIASDELVMILPDHTLETLSMVDSLGIPDSSPDQTDAVDPDQVPADHNSRGVRNEQDPSSNSVDPDLYDLAQVSETRPNQSSYAIGLSAIAISLGFMSEVKVPDIKMLSLDDVLALLAHNDDSGEGQPNSRIEKYGLDQGETQIFMSSQAEFFDKISAKVEETDTSRESYPNDHIQAGLHKHIEDFLKDLESKFSILSDDTKNLDDLRSTSDIITLVGAEPNTNMPNEGDKNIVTTQKVASAQNLDQISQILSKVEFLNTTLALDVNLNEYAVANDTVIATFDVDASELHKTSSLIANSSESESTVSKLINSDQDELSEDKESNYYNDDTLNFMVFLDSKNNELEIIAIENEVIILDPEVFAENDSETFVMSWTLENGAVVSTIGLRNDYESYDILA